MSAPLSLFLLRTVLFPHMPLSLHIFEDRYREMMNDCFEAGTSFGIVAIREGVEVGPRAVPHRVGTLAKIIHREDLADGRMNLLVTGATRFRLLRDLPGKPYRRADVEYLAEPTEDDIPDGMTAELVMAFERYIHALQRVSGSGTSDVPSLPHEPEILSYLVAATLESTLMARQQILEAGNLEQRIRLELSMLRREEDLIGRSVVPTAVSAGYFSLN